MLQRTQNFIRTTLIGGVIVILPTIILVLAFKWLFGFVANAIRPLTNLAVDTIPLPARFNEPIATLIVLAVIILACFLSGFSYGHAWVRSSIAVSKKASLAGHRATG
jgi:uncharacterized membrane protein